MKRIFALIAVAVMAMTAAAQGHQNAKGSQVEQSTSLENHKLWFNMQASELKAKAEQGVTDAQYYLGFRHMIGRGVEHDYSQAEYWLKKAADKGDSRAQYELGIIYATDSGPVEYTAYYDLEKAKYWYGKAAAQGYEAAAEALKKLEKKEEKAKRMEGLKSVKKETNDSIDLGDVLEYMENPWLF